MTLMGFLTNNPVLETERLILRPLVPEDAIDLEKWLSDPELYTYWGRPPIMSELDPRLLFIDKKRSHTKPLPDLSIRWGIVFKPARRINTARHSNIDSPVIGEISLVEIEDNRMAKVAYRIARDFRGLGIATEALRRVIDFAFRETELLRLWTNVDDRNTASKKVLEKCGFTCEGLIRQGKMVMTYCNYRIYGILKEDYIT
jgi:ribosomal-protein-alanine N-acetyltransferase